MGMTILYRDPRRPEEGSMTMIADKTKAEVAVNRLEKRGFVVDKITFTLRAEQWPT